MLRYKYSLLVGILLGIAAIAFMIHAASEFSKAMGYAGNEKKFSQKEWAKPEYGEDRQKMTDDLQIHYLRKGLTKKQVLKLLGKPDRNGHYSYSYSSKENEYSYDMGINFLDPCTFDLEFSDKGILVSYSVNSN